MEVRGITVSVNYAHLLEITLPRALRHLSECLVITSHEDIATQKVVHANPGAELFITNAFYESGAYFNKGLAIEQGFDVLGRHGQILIWDADCVFPETIPWGLVRPATLNGCRRRICHPIHRWSETVDWTVFGPHNDGGPIGFFQCFDAADIATVRPWYHVGYPHAGGCDAYFLTHWSAANRHILPFYVLHLGQVDQHWFGTSPEAIDRMAAYVHRMNWRGAMRLHDRTAVNRVGPLVDRVEIPGFPVSDFSMPFERRLRG